MYTQTSTPLLLRWSVFLGSCPFDIYENTVCHQDIPERLWHHKCNFGWNSTSAILGRAPEGQVYQAHCAGCSGVETWPQDASAAHVLGDVGLIILPISAFILHVKEGVEVRYSQGIMSKLLCLIEVVMS